MLSEFHLNCFEKPTPLSTNVPTRFHAFCFSCNSCRDQTSFYGSCKKQRHGEWSGALTYGMLLSRFILDSQFM